MNKREQEINKLRKEFIEIQEKAFSIQHDLLMNPEKRAVGLEWIKKQTKDNKMDNKTLNASEAVFGFCGWLTKRNKKTVMSNTDDAAVIANLAGDFCEANKLPKIRDHWHKNLIHPKEQKDTLCQEKLKLDK